MALSVESLRARSASSATWRQRISVSKALGGLGAAALVVLAGLTALVVVGPVFAPHPDTSDLINARLGIFSPGHIFGTDGLGRDIWSRALNGGRVSIFVGLGAVAVGLVVGGGLGVLAGYFRGAFDTVVMRVMDVLLAFPSLVLALTVAAYLGSSITNMTIAIGFFTVPAYARLARASALTWRERDFVLGSRLMGGSHLHVVFRHLIPNVIQPLLAYGLLVMAKAIITEASLSFLGLGLKPPQSSWGVMIAEGRADLQHHPIGVLVPGVLLFTLILSLNLLGDSLRERLRGKGAVHL